MANKYVHLSSEQRKEIERLIDLGKSFTYIGESLGVDRTTIAKEIKRNRCVKGGNFLPYNEFGISRALKKCDKLNRPPYCCNHCKERRYCPIHLYYNASNAQKHYDEIKVNSREGIDITKENIDLINANIVPLIRNKKQSVNQVYINHPDILYMSKPTFYKYVNIGAISLSDYELPRKVRYKSRVKVKDKIYKNKIALLIGRTYEDFVIRTYGNKKMMIWQLDTVIGKATNKKTLMTFLLVDTNFMIIRLLSKKDTKNVNKAFDKIKEDLGIELESNHKYIRYYLPKSTSFEDLTEEQVKGIEDNINNIPREILGGKTPYELTKEKYPELIDKLNSKYIEPDDVTLNPDDIFKK